MAVTGKFDADFSDFKNEVDESTEKLRKMEDQADAVGAAVDKALEPKGGGAGVLDTLGGALGNVGQAASTTATNLEQVAVASDAAAAGGVQVVSVAEMEAAGFLTLQSATAETIGELASMTGAVEVLGAAFIGWKIGRVISDLFDLDKKIGDLTASSLGLGDATYQAAASGMSTLERASEAAGYQITNMSEAVRVLTEKDLERLKTVLRGVADQQADREFAKWHHEIEELTQAGLIPQLTKDLDSHAFTLKQLAQWYQVDIEAIQEFKRELDKQRAAEKDADQSHADFLKEVQRILKETDDEKNKQEALDAKVRELERNHISTLIGGFEVLSKAEQQQTQKELESVAKKIAAHEKLVAAMNQEIGIAKQENADMTMGPAQNDPAANAAAIRDARLSSIAAQQKQAPEVDLSELIVNAWLKFDQDVGARGGGAKAAPQAIVNMNVSGVFDPATVRQLTDAISQELTRRVGADRYLPAR